MDTVELTVEEARAIADLIWGKPVNTRWLCSASKKITAAIEKDDLGHAVDLIYGEKFYQ